MLLWVSENKSTERRSTADYRMKTMKRKGKCLKVLRTRCLFAGNT